ncbi:MAG: ABC transporter ATP-binding protein, partial [Lysobacterales bacterium]
YMDEAERCHALAILDKGVLVAEGSPAQLQAAIDAQIVLVESDQPRRVGKLLEEQAFVHSSAQIGNVLRVMVASDLSSPEVAIGEVIKNNGLSLKSCISAEAGLEDVFVASTRAKKSPS